MKQIDRLLIKAARIKPKYDGLFIISNETGMWKVGEKEFPTLADAERYIDELSDADDALLIINDAGPGTERSTLVHDENKIKAGNSVRRAPDIKKSDEHGSKRRNGRKDSEYNHSWV